MNRGSLVFTAAFISVAAFAHHGPPNNVLYDLENITELEGEVTEIFWRNPHVRFRMRNEDGAIWEIESGPVTWLSRLGWTAERIAQFVTDAVLATPSAD